MTAPPPTATTALERQERDPATGRFGPGNPGRRKGARHEALRALEAIGSDNAEALMEKAVAMALAGDTQAMRILMDRLYPVRRGRPVTFDLGELRTAEDAAEAAGAVLREVAAGQMTPEEGGAVAALLQAHREAVLMRDVETRLRAMEERRGGKQA